LQFPFSLSPQIWPSLDDVCVYALDRRTDGVTLAQFSITYAYALCTYLS